MAEFFDEFITQSTEEEQAQESLSDEAVALFAAIFPSLRSLLSRRLGAMPQGTHRLPKRLSERLTKLLNEIGKRQGDAYKEVFAKQLADLEQIARIQWGFTRQQFNTHFNINNLKRPPAAEMRSRIVNTPMSEVGGIKDWQKEIRRRGLAQVRTQIETLYRQGLTDKDIVARIVGTPANKYSDGMFNKLAGEIRKLSRTAHTHAVTMSREAIYEANRNRISGVRWVSVLDARTSLICASLDGTVYPVGEGQRPPAHPNCRSRTVPVVRGQEEVSEEGDVSFSEWFDNQSTTFQKEYLGPSRFKLYEKGSIQLDGFVKANKVISLNELERRTEGR